MTRQPGGNIDAIREALAEGVSALHGQNSPDAGKPAAAAAADKVAAQLQQAKGPFTLKALKEQATKENTMMAGGAVLVADGVRRAVKRDDEGNRHVVRGAVQATIGVGAFTAALATKRASQSPDGGQSR